MDKSVFATLNAVNCNDHTENKNGLTYLSWAWAWAEVKKRFPLATYTIYENPDGWNYFTDGRTCWVKTGVTIEGLEHIEYLPVMDYRNASIPADKVTSFDVNKAIQRSLTKAAARHGLGLYIYAGEDLPEGQPTPAAKQPSQAVKARRAAAGRAVDHVMTKEQFRERWNSGDDGGGITYDDIADCAKSWGLFASPKTADMMVVKAAVLKAAGVRDGQSYKPLAEDTYWKVVEAFAKGIATKTGGNYRDAWIQMTHAGAEQIAKFDNDAAQVRQAISTK